MSRLFGTDGVRGVANRDLTPDLALALGRAAGLVLAPDGGRVVVGRDTRVSGPMLQGALTAGLCSAGATVLDAGVLPTPGVAWLTRAEDALTRLVEMAPANGWARRALARTLERQSRSGEAVAHHRVADALGAA